MVMNVLFDTLEYSNSLNDSGLSIQQSEAITKATSRAFHQFLENKELVSKSDIHKLEFRLKKHISSIIFKNMSAATTIITIIESIVQFIHK
jgi:hypothetical protein